MKAPRTRDPSGPIGNQRPSANDVPQAGAPVEPPVDRRQEVRSQSRRRACALACEETLPETEDELVLIVDPVRRIPGHALEGERADAGLLDRAFRHEERILALRPVDEIVRDEHPGEPRLEQVADGAAVFLLIVALQPALQIGPRRRQAALGELLRARLVERLAPADLGRELEEIPDRGGPGDARMQDHASAPLRERLAGLEDPVALAVVVDVLGQIQDAVRCARRERVVEAAVEAQVVETPVRPRWICQDAAWRQATQLGFRRAQAGEMDQLAVEPRFEAERTPRGSGLDVGPELGPPLQHVLVAVVEGGALQVVGPAGTGHHAEAPGLAEAAGDVRRRLDEAKSLVALHLGKIVRVEIVRHELEIRLPAKLGGQELIVLPERGPATRRLKLDCAWSVWSCSPATNSLPADSFPNTYSSSASCLYPRFAK